MVRRDRTRSLRRNVQHLKHNGVAWDTAALCDWSTRRGWAAKDTTLLFEFGTGIQRAPDFTLTLNHGRGHRQSHGFEENPCTPPRKLLHHSQSNPAAPRRPNPSEQGREKSPIYVALHSRVILLSSMVIPTFSCWRFAACRVCVGWIHGAKGRRRALRARTGS